MRRAPGPVLGKTYKKMGEITKQKRGLPDEFIKNHEILSKFLVCFTRRFAFTLTSEFDIIVYKQ